MCWQEPTDTLGIKNPRAVDGGTAFQFETRIRVDRERLAILLKEIGATLDKMGT
jgi:hypothetical protein